MGAGKTTIGRKLARKLKFQFFDSDQEIENRTGVKIALIFDIEGETGFRTRETDIIDELTKHPEIVLATGGGAVLDPVNRKALCERGVVVYLQAGLGHLVKRTAADTKRPLLNVDNPKQRLASLLEQRDPIYREMADLIVKTDNKAQNKIVDEIVKYKKSL